MRVLMTADTVGGVWTYALDLARALAPHRVSVALATMGRLPDSDQRAEAAAIPGLTLHPGDFALEWMPDPWDDVASAGDWLLGLERELRPNIVHLNGYAHGALPWRAPVVVAGHSCVQSWWRAVKGEDAPLEWERYATEVRRGLRAANLVIAPTRAMLHALSDHYGPFYDTQVVPNGRDASLFAPGDKQPFVFTAGRVWDEAKNVATLAEASVNLPWSVYVAGESRHPVGDSAPPAALHPLGRLPPAEIARRLSQAAIYALPARYEPFGLSALEAGLSGCALVLGDIPSLREVWGDAALFVPPADPAALRAALCLLIGDPDLRNTMASRALRRAQFYTPERMAQGTLDAYRSVLQETPVCA